MLETVKYLIGSAGPSGFGSKSTAEQVTESCGDLRSITAIITGGTSGIGAETARVLASRGARVILPARSIKNAEETRGRIVTEFPEAEIIVMALDLSSLNSVTNFVTRFHSFAFPLNLLMYVYIILPFPHYIHDTYMHTLFFYFLILINLQY
jgi:predicted Rossmann-fold nucleotide-binding protein